MFMHDEVRVGDELEVRGPIGGWFVWRADTPALLIGGGSGIVPLMAMLRLARRQGILRPRPVACLGPHTPGPLLRPRTARPRDDGHLHPGRSATPPQAAGSHHRRTISSRSSYPDATVYICGSSPFADAATDAVTDIGVPVERIRVERFGPTG